MSTLFYVTRHRARAYVTGMGYYELYINGERVGDSQLDPGWTAYDIRILYNVYDVTSLLKVRTGFLHQNSDTRIFMLDSYTRILIQNFNSRIFMLPCVSLKLLESGPKFGLKKNNLNETHGIIFMLEIFYARIWLKVPLTNAITAWQKYCWRNDWKWVVGFF